MDVLRIGVLSAAKIASVIAEASNHVSEVRVIAVASRAPAKATQFAIRHDVPRTCTYDEMLSSPDIDAVYIPLPTGLSTEWALRAIAKGKHVLVDKPFVSVEALQSIVDAAAVAGVIFMDGTHFVHANRTRRMLHVTNTELGSLRSVTAHFSSPHRFSNKRDIRLDASLEPLGAIGDLGWYCVRAAVVFLGVDRTRVIRRAACVGSEMPGAPGVINDASAVVEFEGGERLNMSCSFETVMRMFVEVSGDRGCVRADDFVTPFSQWNRPGTPSSMKTVTQFETEIGSWADGGYPGLSKCEVTNVDEGNYGIQTVRMLQEFAKMVKGEDLVGASKLAYESIITQRIIDVVHKECIRYLS